MEIRDTNERNSERVEVKLKVEPKPPKTVRLRLLKDVKLIATGKHTGRVYEFSKAGAEVDINYEDAQILLQMRRKPCRSCPSVGSSPYFEIVGGN